MNLSTKYVFSRSKYQTIRIVLITSLFWVFIDAFLIIYLSDCDCSNVPCKQQQHHENIKFKDLPPVPQKLNPDLVVGEDRFKYKKPSSTTYPFSSSNPKHGFLNKLKLWFKEKPSEAKNPSDWPGEGGRGVVIPPKLKPIADKRFAENQFNIVASELIALNRSIPDQRSQA
jgi:hypothetical protein